jgi:hypothetical protein
MGHALEKAHRLLKPGGVLIESHFSGEPFLLEVHHQGQIKHAAPLDRAGDFETFRQAKAALDQAVKDGLFWPVAERVFDYLVYADSLDALREWWAETSSQLMIDGKIVRKVNELVPGTGGAAQVVLRRQVRVGKLKRV